MYNTNVLLYHNKGLKEKQKFLNEIITKYAVW